MPPHWNYRSVYHHNRFFALLNPAGLIYLKKNCAAGCLSLNQGKIQRICDRNHTEDPPRSLIPNFAKAIVKRYEIAGIKKKAYSQPKIFSLETINSALQLNSHEPSDPSPRCSSH
jgi:hypothetical protein